MMLMVIVAMAVYPRVCGGTHVVPPSSVYS